MGLQDLAGAKIVALNSKKRTLYCDDEINKTYVKKFRYLREDERLLYYAEDRVAMYSDCFLLYAIAHMGVATKDSISLFLKALSDKNKQLSIIFEKDKNGIIDRLRNLVNMGFLFVHKYDVVAESDIGELKSHAVSLFTLTESGFHIVRQRLQKVDLRINVAIQYKPIEELIGWAAASYVGAHIANCNSFSDYLDRYLNTKQAGSSFFPMELKTNVNGTAYYIAVMSSFLFHNTMIQTEHEYLEYCAAKLNTIKNYLAMRTKKGVTTVCVVVRDVEDLQEIAKCFCSVPMNDYLCRVFFTGEGIVRELKGDVSKSFLQIVMDSSQKAGYRLESVSPDFM